MLLKSIGLKAHLFGFQSYAPNEVTSFSSAYSSFCNWYEKDFMKNILVNLGGRRQVHFLSTAIDSIRSYLLLKEHDPSEVTFADLIQSLFRYVFTELDRQDEIEKNELADLRKLKLKIKSSSLVKVSEALKHTNITEEELLNAAREMFMPDEDRIHSSVDKLNMSIQAHIKSFNTGVN